MKHISVITVCYNDIAGLRQTIKSVLSQDYTDYEYIIIDGGSTDGSAELIAGYSEYISYWVSEKDNGVYSAMNKGVEKASGEYCIFMNAGDTFVDNNVLSHAAPVLCYADLIVGKANMTRNNEIISTVTPPQKISLGFWLYHSVIHQAAFMRLDSLKERMYDEKLSIVSDWKYMITEYVTGKYDYKSLAFPICNFDTTGISSDNALRMTERESVIKELLPPMLYKEYRDYQNLKNLYVNIPFMDTLNEIFKYRSLVRFLTIFNRYLLKAYKLVMYKNKHVT